MMFLIILLVIICVILALFVLIQNPKGGGLATGNSSASSMFGVQRTGDVLEKGSWVLIALVVVLSMSITTMAKSGSGTGKSRLKDQVDKVVAPASGFGSGQTAPPATTTPPDSAK